ncbi:iron-sulfur cluster assembly scaffold protein [Candidatus Woesearchaeota archaeon]|nr:iron-sulfur cluster assembly scaffold protein [Candidatus Woesearchaeota archaeon]
MFTKEVLERFESPRNVGDLDRFNAQGSAGDPNCSDSIEMRIRFIKGAVEDAKFKVFGCPGAIATTDVFIDLIKGKAIEEALRITEKEISEALGGLPTEHMHCTNLSIEAFKKAVEGYRK